MKNQRSFSLWNPRFCVYCHFIQRIHVSGDLPLSCSENFPWNCHFAQRSQVSSSHLMSLSDKHTKKSSLGYIPFRNKNILTWVLFTIQLPLAYCAIVQVTYIFSTQKLHTCCHNKNVNTTCCNRFPTGICVG